MDLILYSHAGCCLCDRLEQLLGPHLHGRTLVKRDIADNPAWRDAFAERIPVLMHDGRVLLEGRPDEADVARMMTLLNARSAKG